MGDAGLYRSRLADGVDKKFNPRSLVGSFFHNGRECADHFQGCVVAEPAPGVYLLEFFDWLMGEGVAQELVTISRMQEERWRFYDSADWMRNMYERGYAWKGSPSKEGDDDADEVEGDDEGDVRPIPFKFLGGIERES